MTQYRTFIRTWYKRVNGQLVPHAGRKKIIDTGLTYDEARRACKNYNDTNNPGPLSKKMEFESY
jgi:hypothetical protein